jgi:Mg/Co/Ni transporter MgtE
METITLNKNELQELIKTTVRDTIIDVLTQRRDLLEDALLEAIEDIGLARAMEEADKDEYVAEEDILNILRASK